MVVKNIDDYIYYNKIDKIFLDIDGVIFNSTQAIVTMLNQKYGTHATGAEVISWNFKEIVPTLTDEEVEDLFDDNRFFEIVKPNYGALDFLTKYRDKITLVSKCNLNNFIQKRKWFDKMGFSDIPIIPLPINLTKAIINMRDNMTYSLFIDDCTDNLQDVNSDYKIQFREYKDNRYRKWQIEWNGDVLYSWK